MALDRIRTVFGDDRTPSSKSIAAPVKEMGHEQGNTHNHNLVQGRPCHQQQEIIAHIYQPHWLSTANGPSSSSRKPTESRDSLAKPPSAMEDSSSTKKPTIGFFDLPAEIRLHIYEMVNQLNPVLPRQLDLGYPDYHPKPYFSEPVVVGPAKEKQGQRKEDEAADDGWTWVDYEELGLNNTGALKKYTSSDEARPSNSNTTARLLPSSPSSSTTPKPTPNHPPRRLLTPHRPRGYIPSTLLLTSRRLYREARTIPFQQNEFVFATWFSTGSSSALAFLSGLRAWQWASMAYVRLEIPLEDIDGSDALHLANWTALCEKWAFGLRGLRLTIVHLPGALMGGVGGSGNGGGLDFGRSGGGWYGRGGLGRVCPGVGAGEKADGGAGGGGSGSGSGSEADSYPWIDDGLRKLERLRQLEVELKTTVFTDEQKLDWCEGLRRRLGRGQDVEVVCVKKKGE